MNVCLQTPAAIQGIGFKSPLGCADQVSRVALYFNHRSHARDFIQGPKKGVMGTWYVQSNETTCMPRWSEFEDEVRDGPTEPGYSHTKFITPSFYSGLYAIR